MQFEMSVCTVLVRETPRVLTPDQEGDKIQRHPLSSPDFTLDASAIAATSTDVWDMGLGLRAAVFQATSAQSALI